MTAIPDRKITKKSNKCQIRHSSNVVQINWRGTHTASSLAKFIVFDKQKTFEIMHSQNYLLSLRNSKLLQKNLICVPFNGIFFFSRRFISISISESIVMLKTLPLFFSARQLCNYKNAIENSPEVCLKVRTFVVHKL